MAIPELFEQLLRVPGPSGQEARAAKVWRDGVQPFASEVDVDVNGSSWVRVPGTGGGRSLAVVGHIDQIGVHITHIDDEGFLRFGGVGGWDPINLISQRVLLYTKGGPVYGVIGRKAIHLMDEDDRKKVPQLKDLHIDIGALDGDEAKQMVRVGGHRRAGCGADRVPQRPRRIQGARQPCRLLRGCARGAAALRGRRRTR